MPELIDVTPGSPEWLAALAALDALAAGWTKWVADHPDTYDLGRAGGYIAGLDVCARQLAETLERIRSNA